jgi:hypothetical protein
MTVYPHGELEPDHPLLRGPIVVSRRGPRPQPADSVQPQPRASSAQPQPEGPVPAKEPPTVNALRDGYGGRP